MSLPTVLPAADRAVLIARVNQATGAQRDAMRARIVLDGECLSVRASAARRGCSPTTVIKWRARYRDEGLAGLGDRPRCGAPASYGDAERCQVVAAATAQPPFPRSRWTHALIAEHLAGQDTGQVRLTPSPSWVGRALRDAQLPVHKVRGWLHRKPDAAFDDRLAAIEAAVGAARAGAATVVCLDEKTAVGVRTPCHVTTRGRDGVRRREFEYVRAGTISWYGTQDVTSGAVGLIRSATRMDSDAFTMVLDDLVAAHGEDFTIVMDNGAAHTSKHTQRWMSQHPQVRVLLTPFHASWANPVEVQFSVLTRQVITGGHHGSADHLDRAAQAWVIERNRHPCPVRWSWQRRASKPGTSDPDH